MATWLPTDSRCLVWDLESTGVSVFDDRIVTACAALVEFTDAGPKILHQRDWLLAVEVDIPEEANAVHGITTAHAREHGMPAADGIREIAGAIRYAVRSGIPLAAFNASFDASMLSAECERIGIGTLPEFCGADVAPILDGYVIDKQVDRYRPGSRKLGDVAAYYGVALDNAHSADADAIATAHILDRIAGLCAMSAGDLRNVYADRRYPDSMVRAFHTLGRYSVQGLHEARAGWAREQLSGLAMWWRQQAVQKQGQATDLAAELAMSDNGESVDAEALRSDEQYQVLVAEAEDLLNRAASADVELQGVVWPLRSQPTGRAAAA